MQSNDLDDTSAKSANADKPIIALLRRIPFEECVKPNDDIIDNEPAIAPFMNQFVQRGLTSVPGLDVANFQYETDQSLAVFFAIAANTSDHKLLLQGLLAYPRAEQP